MNYLERKVILKESRSSMKMWFMWRHQTHAIFVHNAVKILYNSLCVRFSFSSSVFFVSLIQWILKPWTRRIECSWRTRWVSIGATWSSTSWSGASRIGRWTERRRQQSGRRRSPQPRPRVHWVRLRRRRQRRRRRTTSRRWRERTMQKVGWWWFKKSYSGHPVRNCWFCPGDSLLVLKSQVENKKLASLFIPTLQKLFLFSDLILQIVMVFFWAPAKPNWASLNVRVSLENLWMALKLLKTEFLFFALYKQNRRSVQALSIFPANF